MKGIISHDKARWIEAQFSGEMKSFLAEMEWIAELFVGFQLSG